MMIKLSLEVSLPDDANVTDVVYLLKATRHLVASLWPGAKLHCRPATITDKKWEKVRPVSV